jgi:hypothetical protein
MSQNKAKSAFTTIGTVWKRDPISKKGESTLDYMERATYNFLPDKDVVVTVNGQNINDYFINIERPDVKFHRMLQAGKISQAEFNAKIEAYEKGGKAEALTFELVLGKKKDK